DDVLHHRGGAPAVLLGPLDADPSALVHLAMPLHAALPVVGAFVAHEFEFGGLFLATLGRVRFEPASQFLAKGLVLGAVIEIHLLFVLLARPILRRIFDILSIFIAIIPRDRVRILNDIQEGRAVREVRAGLVQESRGGTFPWPSLPY